MKVHIKSHQIISAFGVVLIVFGVSVIGFGLWYAYGIFSGKTSLPSIFYETGEGRNLPARTLSLSAPSIQGGKFNIEIPEYLETKVSRGLDVAAQDLFVFLLLSGGGRIAYIGINLLKNHSKET